jgi:tetratricopeptide (TPR) repeat protein
MLEDATAETDAPRGDGTRSRRWAVLTAILTLGACAPSGLEEARSALRTNDLPTARRELERDRDRHPDSVDVRLALGEVYYRIARDALDWDGDEGRYLAYLEQSVDQFVVAAKLDPTHPQPHLYLAVMDVYRGDLDGALQGLENSRRLAPTPVADTNLAEVHLYRGELEKAKHWTQEGDLRGAGPGPVTFNRMLIGWSEGDLDAARRDFEILRKRQPDMIRTINLAPLPLTPQSFEQFAGYCCASPGCGPYLEEACSDLGLEARQREVSEQTLLQELRLEMEKRRRLREIYEQRKELELEIEPDVTDEAP